MPVLCLGASHRRAPVELLERLSFGEEDLPKAYRRLRDAVAEAVVLSTCNRVEGYAEVDSYHAGSLALKRFLAESREVPLDAFAEALSTPYEDEAVEHLFTVASGLDSMVLGEPQVLSQVRRALRLAREEGAAGPVLSALFRAAVTAGRRVRAGTAIGASPAAFVDAGVALAEQAMGALAGRAAVVVGSGQMAALAVGVLRSRGVERIDIANRSPERARALARRAGSAAEAHGLDGLGRALARAEVVVTCTGAAGFVIGRADLAPEHGPIFFVDLAVPRDVDPSVASLPGVRVVDVDDLKEALGGDAGATGAVEEARAIVSEAVAGFVARRRADRLAPLIQALNEHGDRVRAAELARLAPRLRRLSGSERDAVESLARGIVAKLLHDPIVRVKEMTAGPGTGDVHAQALAELFGLDVPDHRSGP